ncbi:bifunctional tRNA (5-methylaminomethyl-2-thiouridine)(34)-methyltransferase MnmD/FAD-dependent 5-carboxymethylaminomethyl-2-thiouridine(34) oxidoreductase MnmC [Cellvibrio sp. ARAG 10.3]|uniref:bifunctional tRNA (5-methylaminomethyl-2-thiouridine)(34)-methyltransferase MnmD/FAD-dependent 5-carboxymethylaminomethyl-2-thiouridine(34) oxidoreductase MnmC n=1 Tax=Cellvibrio sp. ARAG 10.3 TaxID=3451358 RepID=UPI003F46B0FB
MTESERVHHAQLDWDAEGQPLSREFGDVYFSRANGLQETRHVFLLHNHLTERWPALGAADTFVIGETGFGSGLNFLAAWQLWNQLAPSDAQLHVVSVEKFPLNKVDLARALALWPELDDFSQQLLTQYPEFIGTGFHRLKFQQDRINLTLIIDDAATGFSQLLGSPHPLFSRACAKIDAWFLDGFAPAKNPQMWSDVLFDVIGQLSHPGTTAATFSAAGIVKQGLRRAGFTVKKVPGFGRKREMVAARVEEAAALAQSANDAIKPPRYAPAPWAVNLNPLPLQRRALVIGGGLAGCHTARALAERGWQVHLLERHEQVAEEASGNPQGVLYAKLSPKQESLANFNLTSLQFALNHYRTFWNQSVWNQPDKTQGIMAQASGVLQLAHDAAEEKLHQLLQEQFDHAKDLVRFVDAQQASELAGVPVACGGLYFPSAGWINPHLLCKALVQHPNIQVTCNTQVMSLQQQHDGWSLCDASGQTILSASTVIIANARDARAFEQAAHLPIKSIRGQVSYLPATDASQSLKTVLCGEGYIGPAYPTEQGWFHCTGATFNLKEKSSALRAEDHLTNIHNLRKTTPALADAFAELDEQTLNGRVAFRCTTPDYLPLIGPVPEREKFLADFAPLRKNAKARIDRPGCYYPGLYINVGHGSRGLAYTPLGAELLAAQICQEVLPVSRELAQALNPGRFLIRDLVRNKV